TTELMAEGCRRLSEQQRMTTSVRLQVGAVGQRALDLAEHVARARLRARQPLDAQVTGGVEQRRFHGVKTTLSASPRRYSSTPSATPSSGGTPAGGALDVHPRGGGRVELGEKSAPRLERLGGRRRGADDVQLTAIHRVERER